MPAAQDVAVLSWRVAITVTGLPGHAPAAFWYARVACRQSRQEASKRLSCGHPKRHNLGPHARYRPEPRMGLMPVAQFRRVRGQLAPLSRRQMIASMVRRSSLRDGRCAASPLRSPLRTQPIGHRSVLASSVSRQPRRKPGVWVMRRVGNYKQTEQGDNPCVLQQPDRHEVSREPRGAHELKRERRRSSPPRSRTINVWCR